MSVLTTVEIQIDALTNRIMKGKEDPRMSAQGLERVEKKLKALREIIYIELDSPGEKQQCHFSVVEILRMVADDFSFTLQEMRGRARNADIVMARSVFCNLAKQAGYTYKEIAGELCKLDHTTAMNMADPEKMAERINKSVNPKIYWAMLDKLRVRVFGQKQPENGQG